MTPQNPNTPAVIEKLNALPLPAKLYGPNVKTELKKAYDADRAKLNEAIKAAVKITNIVGDKRLDVTRIFDEAKKLYMQAEQDALADLAPEAKLALNRVSTYDRAQLAKRRDAEALVKAEGEKELARKRAASSIAAVETKTAERIAEVHQSTALKGVTLVWKYEVTDAALVPREYCNPDPSKLTLAVKNGTRSIAGVRIYEDVQRTGK
jgi:hypothetical protein